MMIVLVGQTGSGKSTIAKRLQEYGYDVVVTYTTRSPRKGERNHIDYNFLTEDVFQTMVDMNEFAEYTEYNALFGHVYYGSAKKDYVDGGNKVIVLNPDGLKMIKRNLIPHFSVLLDVPKDELIKRTSKRGDSIEEVERRLEDDHIKFQSIRDMVDLIVKNTDIDETIKKILESVK